MANKIVFQLKTNGKRKSYSKNDLFQEEEDEETVQPLTNEKDPEERHEMFINKKKKLDISQEQKKIMTTLKPQQSEVDENDLIEISHQLHDKGVLLAEEKSYKEALEVWEKSLVLNPNNYLVWEAKAQALMEMDDDFGAIKAAAFAVQMNPKWPASFLTLSRAQINFGEIELARESIEKAFELCEEDDPIYEEIQEQLDTIVKLLAQKGEIEKVAKGKVIRGRLFENALLSSNQTCGSCLRDASN